MAKWLLLIVLLGAAPIYAQDVQPVTPPIVTVPGTQATVNPDQPSQPAVSVKEVESPAAPSHFADGAVWALVVSFILQYLKKKSWFAFLTDESTARLKTQFGFVTAVLTAAGIHFAVTGSVLDGNGAAITISGVSLDAVKDIAWQWASQQAWYLGIVKTSKS